VRGIGFGFPGMGGLSSERNCVKNKKKVLDIPVKICHINRQGDKVCGAPLPPLTSTLVLSEISVMASRLITLQNIQVKKLSPIIGGSF